MSCVWISLFSYVMIWMITIIGMSFLFAVTNALVQFGPILGAVVTPPDNGKIIFVNTTQNSHRIRI